jgi:hypothetical protein
MAIPIVALAFAVGFFGRKVLTDDEDPSTITRQEGEAIELGSSSDELESTLGEPPRFTQSRGKGEAELDCSYYAIEGEANATWEFCFQKGNLIASQAVELE